MAAKWAVPSAPHPLARTKATRLVRDHPQHRFLGHVAVDQFNDEVIGHQDAGLHGCGRRFPRLRRRLAPAFLHRPRHQLAAVQVRRFLCKVARLGCFECRFRWHYLASINAISGSRSTARTAISRLPTAAVTPGLSLRPSPATPAQWTGSDSPSAHARAPPRTNPRYARGAPPANLRREWPAADAFRTAIH